MKNWVNGFGTCFAIASALGMAWCVYANYPWPSYSREDELAFNQTISKAYNAPGYDGAKKLSVVDLNLLDNH
jgi:hypothetical protein